MSESARDTPDSGHGSHDSTRYALINDLLTRRSLRLGFPAPLEGEFRHALSMESAAVARTSMYYVLLLYLGLGVGIIVLLPPEVLGLWPMGYAFLGLVVVAGILLSRRHQIDPFYEYYATALGLVGIAIAVTLPGLADNPVMRQGSMIGVMPALVVVGGMLNLRLVPAAIAMLCGGVGGLLVIYSLDRMPDWLLVNQTYTGGCLVATILAWLAERRNRLVFLQKSLLALEKQRSDQLAARMQEISRQDGLTGLANRRYFDEMLAREWLRCQRDGSVLTLMFIDVDYFKPYNDHYGHQPGDDCLQRIAAVLEKHTRRPGDLAARYGGEEFVLLYPQTGPEAANQLAEEVRQGIASLKVPHACSEAADHVTVSIGLASMVPEESHHPDELVQRADHGVYEAKRRGRNQVVDTSQG